MNSDNSNNANNNLNGGRRCTLFCYKKQNNDSMAQSDNIIPSNLSSISKKESSFFSKEIEYEIEKNNGQNNQENAEENNKKDNDIVQRRIINVILNEVEGQNFEKNMEILKGKGKCYIRFFLYDDENNFHHFQIHYTSPKKIDQHELKNAQITEKINSQDFLRVLANGKLHLYQQKIGLDDDHMLLNLDDGRKNLYNIAFLNIKLMEYCQKKNMPMFFQ